METYRTLYEDKNFHAYMETVDGVVFMHCSFTGEVNPSTMKFGKSKFEEIVRELRGEGIGELYTYSPNPRFVRFISSGWSLVQKLDEDNYLFQLED